MKTTVWLVGAAAVAALLGFKEARPVAAKGQAETTGLVTLYAHDPLAHDFSFLCGRYGGVFEDHVRQSAGAEIDFSAILPGEFTVGIEGTRKGSILDLGAADALQQRYGYAETPGGGQGFASIRREAGRFVILRNYERQTTQSFLEQRTLARSADHALVASEHVYLARITDTADLSFELVVKFMVVAYAPGQSVTLRWSIIE